MVPDDLDHIHFESNRPIGHEISLERRDPQEKRYPFYHQLFFAAAPL